MQFSATKFLLILLVLAQGSSLCVAQPPSPKSHSPYTSPDGSFSFQYPCGFVFCHRDAKQPELWLPTESCAAVIPVCYASTGKPNDVLACVAYPKETVDGTNLDAAAFSV